MDSNQLKNLMVESDEEETISSEEISVEDLGSDVEIGEDEDEDAEDVSQDEEGSSLEENSQEKEFQDSGSSNESDNDSKSEYATDDEDASFEENNSSVDGTDDENNIEEETDNEVEQLISVPIIYGGIKDTNNITMEYESENDAESCDDIEFISEASSESKSLDGMECTNGEEDINVRTISEVELGMKSDFLDEFIVNLENDLENSVEDNDDEVNKLSAADSEDKKQILAELESEIYQNTCENSDTKIDYLTEASKLKLTLDIIEKCIEMVHAGVSPLELATALYLLPEAVTDEELKKMSKDLNHKKKD